MNEAGCRVLLVVRRSGGVVAPVVTTKRLLSGWAAGCGSACA